MPSSLDARTEAHPPQAEMARPAAVPRLNLNEIYRIPIPLAVHPVPTFFPTNPFWLLQFAYNCVYQIFFSSSHPQPHFKGVFSPDTRSVHITEETTAKILWQQGFFGKGSLSRSEPTWLNREKRRRGLLAKVTSEEITRKRREERKEFKNERARKEREAIEQRLKEEGRILTSIGNSKAQEGPILLENGHTNSTAFLNMRGPETTLEDLLASTGISTKGAYEGLGPELGGQVQSTLSGDSSGEARNKSIRFSTDINQSQASQAESTPLPVLRNGGHKEIEVIENKEYLQLTLEEAFFLAFGFGVLDVVDPETNIPIPTPSLLHLFRSYCHFPPVLTCTHQPDDQFMLSYVVYHHFRSLGWVVRSGIKFGVDFLLYNRGPVFSHAEFAVVILPSYNHPYYSSPEVHTDTETKEKKSWWWLHCVNRVQSQVKKSLLMVYVEVPPPISSCDINEGAKHQETSDIVALLKTYKVREVSLKRWIPNRTRD
ncbi:MAG: tRNA-splicing endonuclease subunit Sen2 [Geoglossum simile]|nr:MAG: tRNA-splicing endonuclease subunit Sen2 [Geoglossum simile]